MSLFGDRLTAAPLGDELRRKGFNECNPYDVLGLGPYSPYRRVYRGRIAIPQKGGHTSDFGYDVLVQFHGHTAVMKTLVQVARGVCYVGIDLGLGSGPYSDAFTSVESWHMLLASITAALQEHSGDQRAHIRHLALSAWSAGYGAVNEILKHGDDDVDAVVLLDGLHASWNPAIPRLNAKRPVDAVSPGTIQPVVDFARKALAGDKTLFFFSHSNIDPVTYPSTRLTADWIIDHFGLKQAKRDPGRQPFGLTATVDSGASHIWSYRGTDTLAHCSHIALIEQVVRDMLEPAWQTPPMARDVPPTPAPALGDPPPPDRAPAADQAGEAPADGPTSRASGVRTGLCAAG
ncbi:MAG: hypothetical protein JW940_01150 [Polyangiaceae bacterium]|nr:hypothetical protein [Polyangiaceae bacterium]